MQRNQRSNSILIDQEKQAFQKMSTSASSTTLKTLTEWITINSGKFHNVAIVHNYIFLCFQSLCLLYRFLLHTRSLLRLYKTNVKDFTGNYKCLLKYKEYIENIENFIKFIN